MLYRPTGLERHGGDRTPPASHTPGSTHGAGSQDGERKEHYHRPTASATTSSTATSTESSVRCAHTKDPVAQVRIGLKLDFFNKIT